MRIIAAVMLFVSMTNTAPAQNFKAHHLLQPVNSFLYQYLLQIQQENTTAEKTTVMVPRLKAISERTKDTGSSYKLTDSVKYGYTGIRASHFDFGSMSYYDMGISTTVAYDTSVFYSNNGAVMPTDRYLSYYNSNNKMVWHAEQVYTLPIFKNDNSDSFFYNQNKLYFNRHYIWNNSTSHYDTLTEKFYLYDGQGRQTEDVSYQYSGAGIYHPQSRNTYSYDASGNLIGQVFYTANGTGWDSMSRIIVSYNSNNLPIKATLQSYSAGWQNLYKDTMDYGSSNFYTFFIEQEWMSNQWINTYREIKHLNTQSLPDSQYISSWNTSLNNWSVPTKVYWEYDPLYPVPVKEWIFNSTNVLTDSLHYYYELYNNPSSVETVAKENDFLIYPNPATDMIYVKRQDGQKIEVATRVVNAQGQIVYQRNTTENKIPLSNLPSGVYWLYLSKDGEKIYGSSFIKQ